MKAIVKIHEGGNTKAELAYCLDPDAKSKRDKMPVELMTGSDLLEQSGERVAEVFGQGMNHHALALKDEARLVSELIKRPNELSRSGKNTRHVVISAEFEEGENLTDEEINEKLRFAAEDFLDKFVPGSKAVVVIHRDSSQPHVHIIIENYDCSLVEAGESAKRLDWSPADLNEMQSMDFTEQFSMGRGSRKNAEKKNEKDILETGKPLLGRKKADQRLGDEVVKMLGHNCVLRDESLVDVIEKLDNFEVKRFSPAGALLKTPSVKHGDTVVRLNRVVAHLNNVEAFEKDLANNFLKDSALLFKTCDSAKGKYELDKKRDVRVPAVHGFLKKWSDISDRLYTTKNTLKIKLDKYLRKLSIYEKDDSLYEVDELDYYVKKALRIHVGLDEAPAKKSPAKRQDKLHGEEIER